MTLAMTFSETWWIWLIIFLAGFIGIVIRWGRAFTNPFGELSRMAGSLIGEEKKNPYKVEIFLSIILVASFLLLSISLLFKLIG